MDITYQIVNSEISATVILNRKRFIHNVTQRSYPFSLHIFVAIEKKDVCCTDLSVYFIFWHTTLT